MDRESYHPFNTVDSKTVFINSKDIPNQNYTGLTKLKKIPTNLEQDKTSSLEQYPFQSIDLYM